jgi:ankyrin repeat protein
LGTNSISYLQLLNLDLDLQRHDTICYQILVEILDFMFIGCEVLRDHKDHYGEKNIQGMSLFSALESTRSALQRYRHVLQRLRWFYGKQSRLLDLNSAFPEFAKDGETKPPARLQEFVKFSIYHQFAIGDSPVPFQATDWPGRDKPDEQSRAYEPDIFGWTPLHYASLGDDDQVFSVVCERIPVRYELCDNSGRTPLHYAAMYNVYRVIQLIDQRKEAVEVRARDGAFPMHCAARHGNRVRDTRMMYYALRNSKQHVTDSFGRSVLHLSVIGGNISIFNRALRDEDLDAQCSDELSRRTPLHLAIVLGHNELAMTIIREHFRFNIMTVSDMNGDTPLQSVLKGGDKKLLKVLYERVLDQTSVRTSNQDGQDFFALMLYEASRLGCDSELHTMLGFIESAKHGNVVLNACSMADRKPRDSSVLVTILKAIDAQKKRIAESIADHDIESVREPWIDKLLQAVANARTVDPSKNLAVNEAGGSSQTTSLIDAIRMGRTELVEFLSTCDEIDPNLADANGDTALSWCAMLSDSKMANLLLAKFPNIQTMTRNREGESPLIVLYTKNDTDGIRLLLGAETKDLSGYEGAMLLSQSSFRQKDDLVRLFIGSGADLWSTDDAGRRQISLLLTYKHCSLYHYIIKRGEMTNKTNALEENLALLFHFFASFQDLGKQPSKVYFEELIKRKVDPNALDRNNWTALRLARQQRNEYVVEKILKYIQEYCPTNPRPDPDPFPPSAWSLRHDNPFFLVSPHNSEEDEYAGIVTHVYKSIRL